MINLNSLNYEILQIGLVFLLPFSIILVTTPDLIRKLKKRGTVVKDYYKIGNKMIPIEGGIAILLAVLFSISINEMFYNFEPSNYVALNVIMLFGLFGILDDMIDIGRPVNRSVMLI